MADIPDSYKARIEANKEKARGTLYSDGHSVLAINNNGDRFFYAKRKNPSYSAGNGFEIKGGLGQYWEVRYGLLGAKKSFIREFGYIYEYGRLKNYSSTNGEDGSVIQIPKQVPTKKEVMEILNKLEFKGFANLKKTDELIGI